MPYVATVNIPGYLPQDDEPPVFDTPAEAWAYLAEERERGEDMYPESESDYSDTYRTLERIAAAFANGVPSHQWFLDITIGISHDGTGTLYGSTPGYDGSHDLGLAYCVTLAE